MRLFLMFWTAVIAISLICSGCANNAEVKKEQVPVQIQSEVIDKKDKTDIQTERLANLEENSPESIKTWTGVKTPGISKRTSVTPKIESYQHSILVIGDSLSVGVGLVMTSMLKSKKDVKVSNKGKVSTGLNSPKYYDWEAKLREFIKNENPGIIVVLIGGNDANNGTASTAWSENYRQKVASFLKITAEHNISVYWAGLPTMGDPEYNKKVKTANTAMENACQEFSNCHYIDTYNLTSGEDREFTSKKAMNGKEVTIRAGDGCHFTLTGYKILTAHILHEINARENL